MTSDLALHASRMALERPLEPADIDLIIVGTTTPDHTFSRNRRPAAAQARHQPWRRL